MKQISRHRVFEKQFKKLPKSVRLKFKERIELFYQDTKHPLLNTHPLKGDRVGQWSINITADYRAIYIEKDENIIFLEIGTHTYLYE